MNAAVVLGLMDPQGGKVMRSGYELGPNDYVITPNDTPESVSQQLGMQAQELEGMQTGDVVPYDAPEMEQGMILKNSPKHINYELFEEVLELEDASDKVLEVMDILADMDEAEYEEAEVSALMGIDEFYAKQALTGEEINMVRETYKNKYPDASNNLESMFASAMQTEMSNLSKLAGSMYDYKPEGTEPTETNPLDFNQQNPMQGPLDEETMQDYDELKSGGFYGN